MRFRRCSTMMLLSIVVAGLWGAALPPVRAEDHKPASDDTQLKNASAAAPEGKPGCDPNQPHPKKPAIHGGMEWLARHQMPDGSWSLGGYTQRCKDSSCTGQGDIKADAGATALGLLPFLGAGQNHKHGDFRASIDKGIHWLLEHQKPDGDLATGADLPMYSHGLATIVLCEDYLASNDEQLKKSAQLAIEFIEKSQNKSDGGWRSTSDAPSDMSMTGLQVMALKSAQNAGLPVAQDVLDRARNWLKIVGPIGDGTFAYQGGRYATPAMSAVGLLAAQHLGAKRDDPLIQSGRKYLMAHLPDAAEPNCYYWFHAQMVMHRVPGADWDTWNRKTRDILVNSQVTEGCAAGSWDPANPKDPWGSRGGRLMQTSLSCLTLEVYYRYFSLSQGDWVYQIDGGTSAKPAEKPPEKQ